MMCAAAAALSVCAADDEKKEADDAGGKAAEAAAVEADESKQDSKQDAGFARYQSIIDRQPFGPPPPGFDPSLPPGQQTGSVAEAAGGRTEAELSAEEQKMMSSVRVSVLNVTPAGAVMVGFTDSTTQPPVNYYLKVGETSTDAAKWLVKDANPAEGTVSLSKDGIDITLNVGGETKKGEAIGNKPAAQGMAGGIRPAPGLAGGARPAGGSPSSFRARMNAMGAVEHPQGGGPQGGALARLHERRMQRQAAEAAQRQAAETARAEREAKQEAERERERAQIEADREQQRQDRELQREQLRQIQEELRRVREAKKAAGGDDDQEQPQE